jgi:hypothetical protein
VGLNARPLPLEPAAARRRWPWSAALGALGLTPTFFERAGRWGPAALQAATVAVLAVGTAWLVRPAVPPAPVSLVRPTLARAVTDLEPIDPVARVTMNDLRAWGGLTAFTPVAAPAALLQAIEHRWRHEGRVVSTVKLATPVHGGRPGGFRTFSRKTDFPPDALGRWTVDVMTASGQLIGRLRFEVGE